MFLIKLDVFSTYGGMGREWLPIVRTSNHGVTAAGELPSMLLQGQQLKIEGALREPDKGDGDYRQRSAGQD